MISIARYMKGISNASPTTVVSANSAILAGLCATVLDYIGVYVFAGEFIGLRSQLEEPHGVLAGYVGESEAAAIDESVRAALSGYSHASRDTLQKTTVEMQQMLGVLGHALAVLSGGSDRSVSRFQAIQETLQRTSAIQDVAALRAQLRNVVQLIGEESSREQQTLMGEREAIESQVVRFRDLLAGNPNRRLRGRAEGVRAVSDLLASSEPGKRVWVLAFVLEQLKGIVQRYGPAVTDDLFLQLIRERIHPIAPNNSAFRWSPSAVVGVAQLETDQTELQNRMAALNQAPLVCRVVLDNRTAILKVGLSHLQLEASVVPGSSGLPLDRLIAEIDRFTRAGASEPA